MRVLILSEATYPHHYGGAGKSAYLLAADLAARGHEVVLLSEGPVEEPEREAFAGVEGARIPFSWFGGDDDLRPPSLDRLLERLDAFWPAGFDIVHDLGGFVAHRYAVDCAYRERGARLVLGVQLVLPAYLRAHHDATHAAGVRFEPFGELQDPEERRQKLSQCVAVRLADRLVVPSAKEADLLVAAYAPPPGQLRVLPGPVPKGLFDLQPPPATEPLVAFGGRLDDPVKGVGFVAETMRIVLARRPAARLLVLADGVPPLLRSFGDSIDHAGWLVDDLDVGRALQRAVALVMPSRYESFGMLAAEAMAVGVPAIVSPGCGVAERIEDGLNGFVLGADEARWPEEMARRVLQILDDPAGGRAMGARARAAVQGLASDAFAAETEALYAEVLSDAPAARTVSPPRTSEVHVRLLDRFVSDHVLGNEAVAPDRPAFAPIGTLAPTRCPSCTYAVLAGESRTLVDLGRARGRGADPAAGWTAGEVAAFESVCPIGITQWALVDGSACERQIPVPS